MEPIELPGGYACDDGAVHYAVELEALDGAAEAALADAPPDACVAAITTTVLAFGLKRVGGIREITPALVRDLSVEDREYLIVRLREMTIGPAMWVSLECPHAECGKTMDIRIMLDQAAVDRRPATARWFTIEAAPDLPFRLPTGSDQEWAQASGIMDAATLRNGMLARCMGLSLSEVEALPGDLADAIESRMEELAPDVRPEVEGHCPECRRPFTSRLDLAFLALREVKARSHELEREIHVLAWNYKWPERDILALSRPKRQRYVRLIEEELERMA